MWQMECFYDEKERPLALTPFFFLFGRFVSTQAWQFSVHMLCSNGVLLVFTYMPSLRFSCAMNCHER